MQSLAKSFFTQNGAKLTPVGLNNRVRIAAAGFVGEIFGTLPDNYDDVVNAADRAATKEIPLIQQQVLEVVRNETLGLVQTAWIGLRRMVLAKRQSESRLIRKLVKNSANRVVCETATPNIDAHNDEVMLVELAGALRAYALKATTFDDRAVARTVAAGLEDDELEKDVRRWAPGLPEVAPPMFPSWASSISILFIKLMIIKTGLRSHILFCPVPCTYAARFV